jgi:hypothetical protein
MTYRRRRRTAEEIERMGMINLWIGMSCSLAGILLTYLSMVM